MLSCPILYKKESFSYVIDNCKSNILIFMFSF